MQDTTDDGRWILVDGRRWRATDPHIPDALRQELVDELMSARRAVGAANRAGDDAAVRRARDRVDDAKRALGERGEPWWDEPTPEGAQRRLRAAILALARHRSPRTICPSDAARAVGGEGWRTSMDAARSVAATLQEDGEIVVTQRGEPVDLAAGVRGPVRLGAVGETNPSKEVRRRS